MEEMKNGEKNLDWGNLGFGYMTTDYRYVANYKGWKVGRWSTGNRSLLLH